MSGEENPLLGGTPRKDRESHEDGQIELDSIRPKPECDPSSMLRGSEAQVPKLALEAADADDSVDFVWSAFAYLLKILFSFGAAPSLWMTTPEGSRDKHDRARRKMVDLFSLPNVAIASHYWNVGLAMNFLSTPIAYYLVDSLSYRLQLPQGAPCGPRLPAPLRHARAPRVQRGLHLPATDGGGTTSGLSEPGATGAAASVRVRAGGERAAPGRALRPARGRGGAALRAVVDGASGPGRLLGRLLPLLAGLAQGPRRGARQRHLARP